jgi:cytochrome c peroxidase
MGMVGSLVLKPGKASGIELVVWYNACVSFESSFVISCQLSIEETAMIRTQRTLVAGIAIAILMTAASTAHRAACAAEPAKGAKKQQGARLLKEALAVFAKLPDKMPGSENDTPARIELGEKLYFERAISINKTQSCNDCHRLDNKMGGVDNLPTSAGAEGKAGDRNSPTTLNAGFHFAQFWDGREPDLASQAKGPVLNPIEMGMPDGEVVLERLKEANYLPLFKKAFPTEEEPLTYDTFAEAVAAFERTLITRDRFDDFLGGDLEALTGREKRGLTLFMEVGCTECHSGALLGGTEFRKMGEVAPYANTKDLGRYEITKKEEDKFVFKVPSLRNIGITQPYFHDGQVKTLPQAVKMMGELQLGVELDDEQTSLIVAFLRSLTDKDRVPVPKKKPKPA